MKQYKQKREEGFTIIEVLIVLAIAGLIMLVVFLAVPALQRTSRNTQRKADVSALLGAFSDATSNSGGTLPASCTGAVATCWVKDAKLGYYDGTSTNVKWIKGGAPTNLSPATVTDRDIVVVQSGTKCNTAGDAFDTTQATQRNIAAEYLIESPSGTNGFKVVCQES